MRSATTRSGWLLDLYEDPLGGLVIWFLGEDGERRRLRQRFPVTFYALGSKQRLKTLEQFLHEQPAAPRVWYGERMDAFLRREVPVLAVEVARPGDLADLFRQVSKSFPDLDYANADLQMSLRYAAATKVAPLGRCRVIFDEREMIQSITPLEDPWGLDPSPIPLRVMSLEPDRDPAHTAPRALHVQYGTVEHWLSLTPARPLLINLCALLETYDPDLLLTSWGDTWLLPKLLALTEMYGLPLPLNRDPDAGITRRKERWYFSYGQIIYRGEQVHLFGRWHVDRKNATLWSDYELDGILEMTRVTGLPLQTAARVSPGTGISAIQMQTALRLGILVPWQKQQVERPKSSFDLFAADQGGLVYQPLMGVHRNIIEADFISMYPAIMVHRNISPETLGHSGPQAVQVPGLNLVIDHSYNGLVPQALRPLLEKRVALKLRQARLPGWDARQRIDRRRSSALKWLLVTCFGYLGYKNARFGRIEAHQAVTAYGREALLQAKEAAEDLGFEVIQVYVDGLWLKGSGGIDVADLEALLAEVRARSGLPIALEGIYRWVVFLPSRVNPRRPVANRYFGVFQDGEIKVRGIAARRRDTPPFIANVQMALLETLAEAIEPEAALPAASGVLHRRLQELQAGRVPLDQLLLALRLSREVTDYRVPSPAARAARRLQEVGKVVKPGQRVQFLYTLGSPGVWAWDLPGSPDPAMLDTARYKELLLRAAAEVLAPFGWEEEK